jgi:hypothetical protein
MHLEYYNNPRLQIRVVRILCMVPIYALDAWLCLRFKDAAFYLDPVRECYEAFVIYNFYMYLVAYLDEQYGDIALYYASKPQVLHCRGGEGRARAGAARREGVRSGGCTCLGWLRSRWGGGGVAASGQPFIGGWLAGGRRAAARQGAGQSMPLPLPAAGGALLAGVSVAGALGSWVRVLLGDQARHPELRGGAPAHDGCVGRR